MARGGGSSGSTDRSSIEGDGDDAVGTHRRLPIVVINDAADIHVAEGVPVGDRRRRKTDLQIRPQRHPCLHQHKPQNDCRACSGEDAGKDVLFLHQILLFYHFFAFLSAADPLLKLQFHVNITC